MTELYDAVDDKDLERVLRLLAQGHDPNEPDASSEYGATPVLSALGHRTTDILEALLKAGADPNLADKISYPLHSAVRAAKIDAVRVLLDHGADVNRPDVDEPDTVQIGNTPLMCAVRIDPPEEILPMVELLLASGANVNRQNGYGSTALHRAAHGPRQVIERLVEAGADIEIPDDRGRTAIDLLLADEERGVSQYLKRAMVQCAWRGMTHLRRAVLNDDRGQVRELLAAGCDVNAREPDGETALASAARWNDKTGILEALLQAGADPNLVGSHDRFPLANAAYKGNVAAVRCLLDHGASVDLQNAKGETALIWALRAEPPNRDHMHAAARMLLDAGADVNASDGEGQHVLHWAVKSIAPLQVFELLISAGADLEARASYRHQAIDIAKDMELAEVIAFLESVMSGN